MKVLKFGGTSVGSPERIRIVTHIVSEAKKHHDVVVVVSAFSKVTDQLIEMSAIAARGNTRYSIPLKELKDRHISAAEELARADRRKQAQQIVNELCVENEPPRSRAARYQRMKSKSVS